MTLRANKMPGENLGTGSVLFYVIYFVLGKITRMCSEYGLENQNPAYMFCQLQEVVKLMNVTFERAVRHGSCSHSTGFSLESYDCEALRVRVMAQLKETCLGQSSCVFITHLPTAEECADVIPNRPFITQIDYTCILSEGKYVSHYHFYKNGKDSGLHL